MAERCSMSDSVKASPSSVRGLRAGRVLQSKGLLNQHKWVERQVGLQVATTGDNDQAIVGVRSPIPDIPPYHAAGQPEKWKGSPPDVGDSVCKDGKYLDNGGDEQSLEVHEQEAQSRLFSCHPTKAARSDVPDPCGSEEHAQDLIRSFELDAVKHKVFLSHSGTQKDFVAQLCVDLEAGGFFFPFFDQRHHSLPKGEDFVPLIKKAAQLCQVAVIVLSKEFLCSKWPMIELAEFHGAQQAGNKQLKLLPLFYKLSVADLDDKRIEKCWMPSWIEHAKKDERIDVRKWSAAVRAVRGSNGLIFHKDDMSKVGYRKDVVQCISRLSASDLLFGSSQDMVGYDRMCKRVSDQFVKDVSSVGALVLGLYGTSGVGKSTLAKALCDHFSEEFLGRVCYVELDRKLGMGRVKHVELGETSRLKRVKLILERLCGFDMEVLLRISNVGQGLRLMREHMKRDPVFLVIDNVSDDDRSWREALDYLMVGFHPKSRIMVTSRSKCVVEDFFPDVKFCMPVPKLRVEEAGEIFLRSAARTTMKSVFELTDEERRILGLCIEQCLFESEQDDSGSGPDHQKCVSLSDSGSYHPLALMALGDFFRRYVSNTQMLRWGDYLEKNKELRKDVWKSPNCEVMRIIDLQFSTLHRSEQLLFLDIALFFDDIIFLYPWWSPLTHLCEMYDETHTVMERKLRDLVRSGMINVEITQYDDRSRYSVHPLYREFAEGYVVENGVTGLKNVWGVFQSSGSSLRCDAVASRCWSDLVRLRMFDLTRANARVLGSKAMQELQNLVVLQLYWCSYLTVLNLEGLERLRHLELRGLGKLEKVTFSGSSSADEKLGIYESLRCVYLEGLSSLTHLPDFRSCTSLENVLIWSCEKVTNFEGIQCPHVKSLGLIDLVPHQFGSLPNIKSLHALEYFRLFLMRRDDQAPAEDEFTRDIHKMSCFRHLREYFLYLREWHFDVYYSQVLSLIWQKRVGEEGLRGRANVGEGDDSFSEGDDSSSKFTREAIEQLALLHHPDAMAVIASGY